jgi:hypothetical protein
MISNKDQDNRNGFSEFIDKQRKTLEKAKASATQRIARSVHAYFVGLGNSTGFLGTRYEPRPIQQLSSPLPTPEVSVLLSSQLADRATFNYESTLFGAAGSPSGRAISRTKDDGSDREH